MEATVLTHKILRDSRPMQRTVGIVILVALCAEGVQINLSQLFLSEILQDVASAQEEGTPFHYAWLIILISFIIWYETTDYQQVDLLVQCRGARYQNLWFSPNEDQQ